MTSASGPTPDGQDPKELGAEGMRAAVPEGQAPDIASVISHLTELHSRATEGNPRAVFFITAYEEWPQIASTLSSLNGDEKSQRIEQLAMVPFSERLPERDEMGGEQTILTYSEVVGVWGLEFFESGWEFPTKWLGASHWLDITSMWPGVTAQITEFRVDAFARAEEAEARNASLNGEVERLTGELSHWQKSFDGHVYVTNEEWADVCARSRAAEARVKELKADVTALRKLVGDCEGHFLLLGRLLAHTKVKVNGGPASSSRTAAVFECQAAIDAIRAALSSVAQPEPCPVASSDHHVRLLGEALGRVLGHAGMIREGHPMTGPELLMAADTFCEQPAPETPPSRQSDAAVSRYAAIGETSTEGPRWHIWRSGTSGNYVGGRIADQASADAIAAELNRLASIPSRQSDADLLEALRKIKRTLYSAMRSQEQDVIVNGAAHPGLLEPMREILRDIYADFCAVIARHEQVRAAISHQDKTEGGAS